MPINRARLRSETCPPRPSLEVVRPHLAVIDTKNDSVDISMDTDDDVDEGEHKIISQTEPQFVRKQQAQLITITNPHKHRQFHLPSRGHCTTKVAAKEQINRISTGSTAPAPELVADDQDDGDDMSEDESPYRGIMDWGLHAPDAAGTATGDILEYYLDMPAVAPEQVWEEWPLGEGQQRREHQKAAELRQSLGCMNEYRQSRHSMREYRQSQQSMNEYRHSQHSMDKYRHSQEHSRVEHPQTDSQYHYWSQASSDESSNDTPKPLRRKPTRHPRAKEPTETKPATYSLFPKPATYSIFPKSTTAGPQRTHQRERLVDTPHYDINGNILIHPAHSRPANIYTRSAPAILTTSTTTSLDPSRPSTSSSAAPFSPVETPLKSVFEWDSDSPNESGERDGKGLARIARALHMRSTSELHRAKAQAANSNTTPARSAATVSADGNSTHQPSTSGAKKRHGDVFGRLLGRK